MSDPPIPPDTDTAPVLACTVDDVAAIIRARTKDVHGNEFGTFTADTRPTDVQCQQAIDHQVILLHTKVGYVGDMCAELARGAVAIGAAAEIELSYFPEQSRSDRSPYTFLIQRYDTALDGLVACVQGDLPNCPSGVPDVPLSYRYGTVDSMSGVVHGYYTGQVWPPLPLPPVETEGDNGGE